MKYETERGGKEKVVIIIIIITEWLKIMFSAWNIALRLNTLWWAVLIC